MKTEIHDWKRCFFCNEILKRCVSLGLCVIVIALVSAAISGCTNGSPVSPTDGIPTGVYTSAAETVYVELTLQAGQTAAAVLTQQGDLTATSTHRPPTITATVTSTPTPTVSPSATTTPSATPTITLTPVPPTPIICNQAQFIEDVTIPDGSELPASVFFEKVWRIRNTGNCAWDSSYTLTFTGGVVMSNELDIPISQTVNPGAVTDLSVEMYAPQQTGRFRNDWALRDSYGQIFGVGANGGEPFYVDIEVVIPDGIDPNRHFGISYCDASWTSGIGMIGCTQPAGDLLGFVLLINDPALESRTEDELALWMRPNQNLNGRISGKYPFYNVMENEYFVSEISCMAGSPGCDVTYSLAFLNQNNELVDLGSWREVQDDNTQFISVDLSIVEGQRGQFILSVFNNGDPSQADAIWFMPHIVTISDT